MQSLGLAHVRLGAQQKVDCRAYQRQHRQHRQQRAPAGAGEGVARDRLVLNRVLQIYWNM